MLKFIKWNQTKWSHCHNGLYHCPLLKALDLMPEIGQPLSSYPGPVLNQVIDVKVHMLMPDQYPCIPNWHFDMVPRDDQGNQLFDQATDEKRIWIWISGAPLTEFFDYGFIKAEEWFNFSQKDVHRGTASKSFTWRCFIRIAPQEILPAVDEQYWLRRHSQVYLDAQRFTW